MNRSPGSCYRFSPRVLPLLPRVLPLLHFEAVTRPALLPLLRPRLGPDRLLLPPKHPERQGNQPGEPEKGDAVSFCYRVTAFLQYNQLMMWRLRARDFSTGVQFEKIARAHMVCRGCVLMLKSGNAVTAVTGGR